MLRWRSSWRLPVFFAVVRQLEVLIHCNGCPLAPRHCCDRWSWGCEPLGRAKLLGGRSSWEGEAPAEPCSPSEPRNPVSNNHQPCKCTSETGFRTGRAGGGLLATQTVVWVVTVRSLGTSLNHTFSLDGARRWVRVGCTVECGARTVDMNDVARRRTRKAKADSSRDPL